MQQIETSSQKGQDAFLPKADLSLGERVLMLEPSLLEGSIRQLQKVYDPKEVPQVKLIGSGCEKDVYSVVLKDCSFALKIIKESGRDAILQEYDEDGGGRLLSRLSPFTNKHFCKVLISPTGVATSEGAVFVCTEELLEKPNISERAELEAYGIIRAAVRVYLETVGVADQLKHAAPYYRLCLPLDMHWKNLGITTQAGNRQVKLFDLDLGKDYDPDVAVARILGFAGGTWPERMSAALAGLVDVVGTEQAFVLLSQAGKRISSALSEPSQWSSLGFKEATDSGPGYWIYTEYSSCSRCEWRLSKELVDLLLNMKDSCGIEILINSPKIRQAPHF